MRKANWLALIQLNARFRFFSSFQSVLLSFVADYHVLEWTYTMINWIFLATYYIIWTVDGRNLLIFSTICASLHCIVVCNLNICGRTHIQTYADFYCTESVFYHLSSANRRGDRMLVLSSCHQVIVHRLHIHIAYVARSMLKAQYVYHSISFFVVVDSFFCSLLIMYYARGMQCVHCAWYAFSLFCESFLLLMQLNTNYVMCRRALTIFYMQNNEKKTNSQEWDVNFWSVLETGSTDSVCMCLCVYVHYY